MDTIKLINKQDNALRSLMHVHKHDNPNHVIAQYNNFINCSCGYHVHAINDKLVQHNSNYSINVVIAL